MSLLAGGETVWEWRSCSRVEKLFEKDSYENGLGRDTVTADQCDTAEEPYNSESSDDTKFAARERETEDEEAN